MYVHLWNKRVVDATFLWFIGRILFACSRINGELVWQRLMVRELHYH